METRQHTVSELGKQIDELRTLQSKQTDEQMQRTDKLMGNLRSELDGRFDEINTRFNGLEATILKCFSQGPARMRSSEPGSSQSTGFAASPGLLPTPGQTRPPEPPDLVRSEVVVTDGNIDREPAPVNILSTRLTKIGFPSFDGSMLQDWIFACEQFFMIDNTPPETKVRLASMHMSGKARQWHCNYIKGQYDIYPSWP
ncbi:hypothetical protein N665_0116s0143, partial [Sinapis alba]